MEYNLFDYVRPELLILIPVLVIIGKIIKDSAVPNRWIPLMLGGIGIALGVAYMLVFPAELSLAQALLTGAIQGVLCAGCAVYGHQLYKQAKEKDDIVEAKD